MKVQETTSVSVCICVLSNMLYVIYTVMAICRYKHKHLRPTPGTSAFWNQSIQSIHSCAYKKRATTGVSSQWQEGCNENPKVAMSNIHAWSSDTNLDASKFSIRIGFKVDKNTEDLLAFWNLRLTCDSKGTTCMGQSGFPSLFITSFHMCTDCQHAAKLQIQPKASPSPHHSAQPSVSSEASPLSTLPNIMDFACRARRFSRSSGLRTKSSATKLSLPLRARPKAPPCNAETLRLWFLLISWSDLSWLWRLKWLGGNALHGSKGKTWKCWCWTNQVCVPVVTQQVPNWRVLWQNSPKINYPFWTRRLHEITSRKNWYVR